MRVALLDHAELDGGLGLGDSDFGGVFGASVVVGAGTGAAAVVAGAGASVVVA